MRKYGPAVMRKIYNGRQWRDRAEKVRSAAFYVHFRSASRCVLRTFGNHCFMLPQLYSSFTICQVSAVPSTCSNNYNFVNCHWFLHKCTIFINSLHIHVTCSSQCMCCFTGQGVNDWQCSRHTCSILYNKVQVLCSQFSNRCLCIHSLHRIAAYTINAPLTLYIGLFLETSNRLSYFTLSSITNSKSPSV